MKILIVGAGAVGGYYGGMLARARHDVTFVARGAHGDAIRSHGLSVRTPDEQFVVRPPVLGSIDEARGLEVDLAIIAVKSTDLESVAAGVGAALGPAGAALPLENGLDSEEVLAAAIGRERVVGGIAQIASRIFAPGIIQVDAPARIVIAPLPGADQARVLDFAKELSLAGFVCEAKSDLSRVLWTKLLWNSPFNAICALTGLPAGEVLALPDLEQLVRAAMHEVAAVATTEGVEISAALIDATVDATRTTFKDTIPSMLQDVRAGKATEVQVLQGAVVRRAARSGIAVPVHQTLFALVLGLESGLRLRVRRQEEAH